MYTLAGDVPLLEEVHKGLRALLFAIMNGRQLTGYCRPAAAVVVHSKEAKQNLVITGNNFSLSNQAIELGPEIRARK